MSSITLKNKNTGETFEVGDGFSWTTLLFGIFVPLFRRDYSTFVFGLALWAINIGVFGLGFGIVLALPFRFIAACLYNSWHIAKLRGEDHLIEKSISIGNEHKKRELPEGLKQRWEKKVKEDGWGSSRSSSV